MATADELKSVLKETLENRGVLGQIRARVRAEVFSALDDQTETRPSLSNENLLINELIREYLTFNKYKYTESVLLAETGQPKEPMDRGFLSQELNLAEEDSKTSSMPLLYGILAHCLQGGHREARWLRGTRDEPSVQPVSRGDRSVIDSSLTRDPSPLVVRGGRR